MLRFKSENAYPFDDGWHGIHNPGVCFFGSSQGQTTQTQTNAPWSGSQPFISQGLAGAQNLFQNYTPQYYGGNQVAPFSPAQLAGLGGIEGQAFAGEPITGSATGYATGLQNGSYFGANPGSSYFGNMASTNLGLNNPAAGYLSTIAGSNPAAGAPGTDTLANLASTNIGATNPGNAGLAGYASGANLDQNPYFKATSDSIMSQVVPQIESSFFAGNAQNNPAMAFAASQGAASAIAPYAMSNYNQQQQNQMNAGEMLAQNYLGGAGLQTGAAGQLGNESLTGTGLQTGAAGSLESGALGGGSLQNEAAGGVSNNWNDVLGQMTSSLGMSPALQGMSYADYNQLMNAGGVEQTQNQNNINAGMNAWNYYQQLPYAQNSNYLGAVTGNFGSTGTTSTPYFTNPSANFLSSGLGMSQLLGGPNGLFSGLTTQSGGQSPGGSLSNSAGLLSMFGL